MNLSFLNLPDGELEGVHLAEPLLGGQGGEELPETLEGVVDALHPPPLPHVDRVPHVHLVTGLITGSGQYRCTLT